MIISYIKFLLTSTNQHGVHSPFIYNLVTKGLYKKVKPKQKHNKIEQLIIKITNYFDFNSALVIGNVSENIINIISEAKSSSEIVTNTNFSNLNSKIKNTIFDFIYIKTTPTSITCFEALLSHIHNDSVLIINTPYNSTIWEQIKNHNAITVTVDCFYIGIVFFRKEQAKEHFKIRV